jgi:outer membrane protein OmpA-like peptidoglycan-associated protein
MKKFIIAVTSILFVSGCSIPELQRNSQLQAANSQIQAENKAQAAATSPAAANMDAGYTTYFDTNSAKLKAEDHKKLDELVKFAIQHKEAKFDLSGYADNRGSDKLNQKLSINRAKSVRAYLIKKGISAKRLKVTGKGTSNPVADNNTQEGRAQNRRVEIQAIIK